nr:MAG: nonstructural protein [Microvirus sp.]
MKRSMYAVRDRVADFFSPPFLARNDGEAMRMFDASFRQAPPDAHLNRDDLQLFAVGEFDDLSGEIVPSLPSAVVASRGDAL